MNILADIDGTERYATSYLDMNGMVRCSVEKAAYGYVR